MSDKHSNVPAPLATESQSISTAGRLWIWYGLDGHLQIGHTPPPGERYNAIEYVRATAAAELQAEVERLRALVPTGDYVLAEDMDEAQDRRYGKGLFASYDSVKSVS